MIVSQICFKKNIQRTIEKIIIIVVGSSVAVQGRGFLMSSSVTRLYRGRAATHETELGEHDFCLSRSHYTDTDPTSR